MSADFREVITHPAYSLPFMLPGRMVKVKHQKLDYGWGIVVNYQKRLPPKVSTIRALEPPLSHDFRRRTDLVLQLIPSHPTSSTSSMYCSTSPQALYRRKTATEQTPCPKACSLAHQDKKAHHRSCQFSSQPSMLSAICALFCPRTSGQSRRARQHGRVYLKFRGGSLQVLHFSILLRTWASRMRSSRSLSTSVIALPCMCAFRMLILGL